MKKKCYIESKKKEIYISMVYLCKPVTFLPTVTMGVILIFTTVRTSG